MKMYIQWLLSTSTTNYFLVNQIPDKKTAKIRQIQSQI